MNLEAHDRAIINLLRSDNFVSVNKFLIRELGGDEAIIYCEILSKYNWYLDNNKLTPDGYFYWTKEDLQIEFGYKKDKQDSIFRNLQKKGIIDVKLKDLPAKRHIKPINLDKVFSLFFQKEPNQSKETSQLAEKPTTRYRKNRQLDIGKSATNNTNTNNTNNNISSSSSSESMDKELIELFENNICELKKTTKAKFKECCNEFNSDLIIAVLEYAATTGIKSYQGFETIIERTVIPQNITTSEEFIKSVEEYRNKRNEKKKATQTTRSAETTKEKKLRFNNFEAREYDYDELENKLLGWDKD